MDNYDKGLWITILIYAVAILANIGFWGGLLYLGYLLIQKL